MPRLESKAQKTSDKSKDLVLEKSCEKRWVPEYCIIVLIPSSPSGGVDRVDKLFQMMFRPFRGVRNPSCEEVICGPFVFFDGLFEIMQPLPPPERP
jgi:hypothetical protein